MDYLEKHKDHMKIDEVELGKLYFLRRKDYDRELVIFMPVKNYGITTDAVFFSDGYFYNNELKDWIFYNKLNILGSGDFGPVHRKMDKREQRKCIVRLFQAKFNYN